MGEAAVVAQGFRYPAPGADEEMVAAVETLPEGAVGTHMRTFYTAIRRLTPGEWEELHTRTLDLNPLFVPYVGHVAFGETYRRGEFMAALKRAETEAGVDPEGELPDHLAPVLRYLDRVDDPLPDLLAVLPKAVKSMDKELKKADADNPYRHLLGAVGAIVGDLKPSKSGGRS
jgi:nitrate reductase delta subunit